MWSNGNASTEPRSQKLVNKKYIDDKSQDIAVQDVRAMYEMNRKVMFDEVEYALLNVLEGALSLGTCYFGPDSTATAQGRDKSNLQRETLGAYRVSSVEHSGTYKVTCQTIESQGDTWKTIACTARNFQNPVVAVTEGQLNISLVACYRESTVQMLSRCLIF